MTERSKGIVQKQTFLFSFLERKVYAEGTFSLNQYNVFKPLQSTKIFKIKKKKKQFGSGCIQVIIVLAPLLVSRMTMKIQKSEKQSARTKKLKSVKTFELRVIFIPVCNLIGGGPRFSFKMNWFTWQLSSHRADFYPYPHHHRYHHCHQCDGRSRCP